MVLTPPERSYLLAHVQKTIAVIVAICALIEVALAYVSPGARSLNEHIGIVLIVSAPVLIVHFLLDRKKRAAAKAETRTEAEK